MSTAGLAGLIGSLPPGVSPFTAIKQQVDEGVFPPISSSIRTQFYLFIVVHALIALLSISGLWFRFRRGNLWFVRMEGKLIRPNPGPSSQVFFALYSIFFIVALATTTLSATRPSAAAYGFELLPYIFLGLALHIQAMATFLARPNAQTISLNHSASRRSSLISRSPRIFNIAFFLIGALFILSILIGRGIAASARGKLLMTLSEIDGILDTAEREKASLVSLFGLAPIFDRFIAEGKQLERVEMVAIRVWISWAAVWAVIYFPSAFALIKTLRSQDKLLRRAIDNIGEIEALSSLAGNASPMSKQQTDTPRPPTLSRTPSSEPMSPASFSAEPKTPPTPASDHVRGASTQKLELEETRRHLRKLNLVVVTQCITTVVLLLVYTALVVFVLSGAMARLCRVAAHDTTSIWLGYAFLLPGIFSSALFAWISYHSLPTTAPPAKVRSRQVLESDDDDEDFNPFSREYSVQSTRRLSTSATGSPPRSEARSETAPPTPGRSRRVSDGEAKWLPSKFSDLRSSEAILMEVRESK